MATTKKPELPRKDFLTTGDVALRLGVKAWLVMRLWNQGVLPDPPRVGGRRIISEADVPAIEEALRRQGFIK